MLDAAGIGGLAERRGTLGGLLDVWLLRLGGQVLSLVGILLAWKKAAGARIRIVRRLETRMHSRFRPAVDIVAKPFQPQLKLVVLPGNRKPERLAKVLEIEFLEVPDRGSKR